MDPKAGYYVRFRDFDVSVRPGHVPDPMPINLKFRAFIEAVVVSLSDRKLEAPWRKLYFEILVADSPSTFVPASPDVGLSAAGVTLGLHDRALLVAQGETVRGRLADIVGGARDLIRDRSGWDDPSFWESVEMAGSHRGRYEHRMLPVSDRKVGLIYHLT